MGFMFPEPSGMLFAGNGEGFEFEWARSVSESATSGHAKVLVIAVVAVEGNHARIVFVGVESAGDIVVADDEFEEMVSDPKIPQPDEEDHKGLGKLKLRLKIEIDPIVDGEAPRFGSIGAIKDRPLLLPLIVNVDKTEQRQMEKPDKREDANVKDKSMTARGIRVVSRGSGVAAPEESLGVGTGGMANKAGRRTDGVKMPNLLVDSWRDTAAETGQDRGDITMGPTGGAHRCNTKWWQHQSCNEGGKQ
jgi:hypothetical protein